MLSSREPERMTSYRIASCWSHARWTLRQEGPCPGQGSRHSALQPTAHPASMLYWATCWSLNLITLPPWCCSSTWDSVPLPSFRLHGLTNAYSPLVSAHTGFSRQSFRLPSSGLGACLRYFNAPRTQLYVYHTITTICFHSASCEWCVPGILPRAWGWFTLETQCLSSRAGSE